MRLSRAPAVGALVLAAGRSTRLGRPKQLLALGGRPLLQHAIDAATTAGLAEIVVVLGHAADEVAAAIRLPPGARAVVNARHAEGQSTSLRAGIRAMESAVDAALVLLADQPTISPEAIRTVAEGGRASAAPIVQARYGGRPGHPVLLRREIWPDLLALDGDRGARELITSHPEWVAPVEISGPLPPDVDTWEDYERLRAAWEPGGGADAADH